MTSHILEKLASGDPRSTANRDEVIEEVLEWPFLFEELVKGMTHDNPQVRAMATSAADLVSAKKPELIRPHKRHLLSKVAPIEQWEVRSHLSRMLPRLDLNPAEVGKMADLMERSLEHKSSIVRTFAMQALVDLITFDEKLRPSVTGIIERLTETGSAAMKARGRKLLKVLAK